MMLLPCPWCGTRNSQEFAFGGEVVGRPDVTATTPPEWRHYLFFRDNPRGWATEQWYHRAGCRRYFVVERHTETNKVRAARRPAGQLTDTDAGTTPSEGGQAVEEGR